MLTLKVIWPNPPDQPFTNYNVYTARSYGVFGLSDGTTQLLVNNDGPDPIDIRLGFGAYVYVMNANGSTVDTIRESRNPNPVPN